MRTILKTDQYKFAMAEAGHPWQTETFYYSHRKNGPHLMPVDIREYIKNLFSNWKSEPSRTRKDILSYSGLTLGDWFDRMCLLDDPFSLLKINAIHKGSWFADRAPAFTVTGPSFLVSWLEPQILQLNYRIQIATIAATKPHMLKQLEFVTCDHEKDIVKETLVNVKELGYTIDNSAMPKCNLSEYTNDIAKRAKNLVEAVDGDASRIFEVGYRAASCSRQHEQALVACKESGVIATSNTYGAYLYNLKAVGTMGHEHCQRFINDNNAYKAMAERLSGPTFCLLDTHDPIKSGIPTAISLMKREPERNHVMRFDSGDIEKQFRFAVSEYPEGRFCLEDGWNLEKTKHFEQIRKELNLKPEQVLYGYGGYLVSPGWQSFTRDRVAAVWKLCQFKNTPVMKLTGNGKSSLPGKMTLWYKRDSSAMMVACEYENVSNDWINAYSEQVQGKPCVLKLSPGMNNLISNFSDANLFWQ